MHIKRMVENLCKKYDTRDPFELARQLGILIVDEPLGSVRGYYGKSFRIRMIHINSSLSDRQRTITCAHELGHSILHPDANTPFLRECTYFSVSKLELEANRFMAHLLMPDSLLFDFAQSGFSIPQIANMLRLPVDLVSYRLQLTY